MPSPCRVSLRLMVLGVMAALLPGCGSGDEPPPMRILAASSLEPIAASDPAGDMPEVSVGASFVPGSAPAGVAASVQPKFMFKRTLVSLYVN